MKQDRVEELSVILNEYNKKLKENGKISELIGERRNPHINEAIGYYLTIDKEENLHEIEEMEARGFKVIYPGKLKEDARIARGPGKEIIEGKYLNQTMGKRALIIDSNEPKSLEIISMISDHYFSEGHVINGLDYKENSITSHEHGQFQEGTNKEYQDLLNDMGYKTTMDEYGRVTAFSDIPYPAVKKSKFEQIYDNAKGKVKAMFSAIKNRFSSKNQEQVKENEEDERE